MSECRSIFRAVHTWCENPGLSGLIRGLNDGTSVGGKAEIAKNSVRGIYFHYLLILGE